MGDCIMAKSRARQWADILANTPVAYDANNRLTVGDAATASATLDVATDSGDASVEIQAPASSSSILKFGDTADDDAGHLTYNHATDTLTFTVNTLERMRIDSSGKVGIGTTSPAKKLTLTSSTQYDGLLVTNGTNYIAEVVGFGAGNDAGGLKLRNGGTATVEVQANANTFFNGGNVGIGTSSPNSACRLDISGGNLRLRSAGSSPTRLQYFNSANAYTIGVSGGAAIAFHEVSGSQEIGFETHYTGNSHAERMRIDKSGNVGIGTTTPSYTLHVVGAIYATGDVTAYSDIKLKENVKTIENAVDLVNKMRGVTFTRKDTGEDGVGVIAQEMQEVLPQVVSEKDGAIGVAYGNIVGVLIEAVKELSAEVKRLKGE